MYLSKFLFFICYANFMQWKILPFVPVFIFSRVISIEQKNTIEMKFMYFAWAENQFVLISYQMIVCKIPDGTLNNRFIFDSNSDLICTIQKCWWWRWRWGWAYNDDKKKTNRKHIKDVHLWLWSSGYC